MWLCATCGHSIEDAGDGNLIADEQRDTRGQLTGFVNWRCVHKGECDPHSGPWHSLKSFTGKHGDRYLERMRREGAFTGLSPDTIRDLAQMVLR